MIHIHQQKAGESKPTGLSLIHGSCGCFTKEHETDSDNKVSVLQKTCLDNILFIYFLAK